MPSRRRRRRNRPRRAPLSPSRPRSFFRRRSTRWLAAAIITLTVGIVLGVIAAGREDVGGLPDIAPTPTLVVALPGLNPDQQRLQPAEVVRVIDGDTIDVRLAGDVERIRYFGVDTPERGERCFREATERNEALVGERVLLLPDDRERDQFGRLLRYVFDDQGRSIDARLIAEGLAEAWRPDGAYRDELVELEEETRAAGAGCLWGGG